MSMLIKSEIRQKVEKEIMKGLKEEIQTHAFNPIAVDDIENLMHQMKLLDDAEFFFIALDQDKEYEGMDELKTIVANNIKNLMARREVNPDWLAHEIEVPVEYINLMTTGYMYMENPVVLRNIADSLKVDICDLYSTDNIYTIDQDNQYARLGDLGYGSIFRVTFHDAEVEDEEGDTESEDITRDFMVINPGPVIQKAEPDKVFVVDVEDGVMQAFADKDIEVFLVRRCFNEETENE